MTQRSILIVQWESHVSGSPESGRILIEGLLSAGWQVSVVCGHPGPYVEIYRQMKCGVSVIPQKHWLRRRRWFHFPRDVLHGLHVFRQLRQLIRRLHPDVVYINTVVGPEAALAARRCGVPVIWHLRDMFADAGGDLHAPPLVGRRGVRCLIQRLASHVVVVSEAVLRNVVYPMAADRVSVVFNGVDRSFCVERPAESLDASEKCPVVIGVPGTIRPMKGQDFLIRAVASVISDLGDVDVQITGDGGGTYRTQLESLVQQHQLADRVRFVGQVSDMSGFLRQCDIAVIPSSCDPLPRTVMESMACGCAVIGTRVGGIPEMIEHGRTGLLVEYGNVAELAETLQKLVADQGLRRQLGDAAQIQARDQFTTEQYQSTLIRLIEDVCSAQSSSSVEFS